jgi:hypothetical protein
MRYVLVTLSGGIIERVVFFESAGLAVHALSDHVRRMNPEEDDAEVHGPNGLVACAKEFLDTHDRFIERADMITALPEEKEKPIYIIANRNHPLGFMVASPDDPMGYEDPVEALSVLETLREDFGNHLKLYRVVPVEHPVATRNDLDKYSKENDMEGHVWPLVEEYVA